MRPFWNLQSSIWNPLTQVDLIYSTFYCIYRYELIDILRNNNFTTPDMRISDVYVTNKRAKQTQRRILKGFNINTVDGAIREAFASKNGNPSKDFFKTIAKAISSKKESKLCQLFGCFILYWLLDFSWLLFFQDYSLKSRQSALFLLHRLTILQPWVRKKSQCPWL